MNIFRWHPSFVKLMSLVWERVSFDTYSDTASQHVVMSFDSKDWRE
jgi:hypothetical protein